MTQPPAAKIPVTSKGVEIVWESVTELVGESEAWDGWGKPSFVVFCCTCPFFFKFSLYPKSRSGIFETDLVIYNPATPPHCWTPRKVPKCEKPGCWGSQLKSRRPCRSHLSWSAPPCLTCFILPSRPPKYTKCYWSLPPTWWKEKSHPRLRKHPSMMRIKF